MSGSSWSELRPIGKPPSFLCLGVREEEEDQGHHSSPSEREPGSLQAVGLGVHRCIHLCEPGWAGCAPHDPA